MPDSLELLVGDGALNDIGGYSWIITEAAGIRFGDNPAYTLADDFLPMYPQFGAGALPNLVLQTYINLASACLAYERWEDTWAVAMGLYVAHYATLYAQSMTPAGATYKQLAQAGIARGFQASKSVADLSVSYQPITSGWESWGDWNLTLFGQQLMHFAKIIGMGPVWVW